MPRHHRDLVNRCEIQPLVLGLCVDIKMPQYASVNKTSVLIPLPLGIGEMAPSIRISPSSDEMSLEKLVGRLEWPGASTI